VTGEFAPVPAAAPPAVVVPTPPVTEAAPAAGQSSDEAGLQAAPSVDAPAAVATDADSTAEERRPGDHKVEAGGTAAEGAKPRAAKAVTDAERPAASTEGDAETAAQDDNGHAVVRPQEKAEHAEPSASRAPHHTAAAKPEAERAPVDPQVSATADKPSADVVQLVTQQHPADRSAGASSVAPGTAHSATAQADQSVAVPIAGLALEIAGRALSGRSRFEIRLDPPELGRIDVRLDLDRAGQVTSRLVVDKVETLDLLRRDAPELERALQQAGLTTGDSGLQFTLRDQSFSGGNQERGDSADAARLIVADPELAPVEPAASSYGRSLRLGGGIDIRV